MAIAGKLNTLQLKAESAYGSDPTMAVTDVVRFRNLKILNKQKFLKNDAVLPSFSHFADEIGEAWSDATFETLLHGSGTANTAPKMGALLLAAGMTATPTSVITYTLNSSPTVASVYLSGVNGTIVDVCAGGVVEQLEIGWKGAEIIYPKWTVKGLWTATDEGAMIVPTFETQSPLKSKGFTFTIQDAYAPNLRSFNLVLKNTVSPIYLPSNGNSISGWQIVGREITGNFVVDAVPPTVGGSVEEHDYFGRAKAGTLGALSVILGSSSANRWTIYASKMQYLDVEKTEEDGISCFDVKFQLCVNAPATGNDELSFIHG
jgi:hypothetical protein